MFGIGRKKRQLFTKPKPTIFSGEVIRTWLTAVLVVFGFFVLIALTAAITG